MARYCIQNTTVGSQATTSRAGIEHAPAEVTVAGADVEHALALEFQMRRDPVPLPVRTPFGVHDDTAEVQRPLAPRDQGLQGFGQRSWTVERCTGDQHAVVDAPAGFDFG
nr:hypothetical protein [Wenzhouxiangella limi]